MDNNCNCARCQSKRYGYVVFDEKEYYKEDSMNMYVLCRQDLDKFTQSYKFVQGMHAVAEYLLRNKTEWNNGTMIALAVKDVHQLEHWKRKLEFQGITCSAFYEPDIGNEMTAIACVAEEDTFKGLRLIQ